jgi:hypothetical protein
MSQLDDQDQLPLVYANWFLAAPSPFELALDFGYQAADMERPQRSIRIVNTWEHAKLLKQVLDQIIEARESNVGEIPVPPGVQMRDVAQIDGSDK